MFLNGVDKTDVRTALSWCDGDMCLCDGWCDGATDWCDGACMQLSTAIPKSSGSGILGVNYAEDDDLDGEPMDEDLDGEPMDEDVDGEPMQGMPGVLDVLRVSCTGMLTCCLC